VAEKVEQALFITLAEGKNLTGDLSPRGHGVGTAAFTEQVIANFGRVSNQPSRNYQKLELQSWPKLTRIWSRARVSWSVSMCSWRRVSAPRS